MCPARNPGRGGKAATMDPNGIKDVLSFILTCAGGLMCAFALVLYATAKMTDHGGDGVSDSKMMACALAAIAFFAAAGMIKTMNFTYGG